MKNLHLATENELQALLQLAIGRAFRMAAAGNEEAAMSAKRQALSINDEIKSRA